jgi:DNA-binding MarR family transcriptional regulator
VPGQEPGSPRPLVRVESSFERRWPGASGPATECVLNTYVLAVMIERASTAWLKDQGLPSLTAFNVLTILHGAGEPLQPSTISDRLMVTRGTLTGILDTLERNGYTQRTQHAQDGRMRWVRLTSKGQAVVDALRPRIHRAERGLVTSLTRAEQEMLIDMLGRMQQAASELRFDSEPDGKTKPPEVAAPEH